MAIGEPSVGKSALREHIESLEKESIACAYNHIKEHKILYILIDEAHLLDMHVLRKLRLLFEQLIYMDVMNAVGREGTLGYLSYHPKSQHQDQHPPAQTTPSTT